MAMKTIQVRLPERLIQEMETEVKKGNYESKSDYVRSNLKFKKDFSELVGLLPNKGNSVKEIRELRRKESEKLKNLKTKEEIQNYIDNLNNLIK